jgi:SET domain-containing protein
VFDTSKVYVGPSPIHGWGVFAAQSFRPGEVICSAPVTVLPDHPGGVLSSYVFQHQQGVAVAWGVNSLINHGDTPNSIWTYSCQLESQIFSALRPIQAGKEITHRYLDRA